MIVPHSVRWLITLALVAIVIVVSVTPARAQSGDSLFVWLVTVTPSTIQKLMHFGVYATLALLWSWALEGVGPRWLQLTIALVLAVSLGAALEWYQTMVPGRFGTLLDVGLNAIGAFAGMIVALLLL